MLRRPSFFFPTRSPPKMACHFRGGQEHKWVGEKDGFSSDFFKIRGNNGSLRAPIRDQCPERTREKNVKKKTRAPIEDRCPGVFFPSHFWLGEKHANQRNSRPLKLLWNLKRSGIGGTAVPSNSFGI